MTDWLTRAVKRTAFAASLIAIPPVVTIATVDFYLKPHWSYAERTRIDCADPLPAYNFDVYGAPQHTGENLHARFEKAFRWFCQDGRNI